MCNRSMGPVGRVTSDFADHEDQVYLVPSNFCDWLSFFFTGHIGKLPQTSLLNLGKNERKADSV